MSSKVNPMLLFDLETDGLLDAFTRIHCLAIHDTETGETIAYNDQGNTDPIVRGIQRLNDAESICGHNIISFDLPVIKKLYPWFEYPYVVDTLLLSRLYHSDMMALDKKMNWKYMPLKDYGRHSLESYGYRLKEYKGAFCKETDWMEWSQSMEDYCIQDVAVTLKLWQHFQPYLNGSKWSTR